MHALNTEISYILEEISYILEEIPYILEEIPHILVHMDTTYSCITEYIFMSYGVATVSRID